jgi:putative acetyltransferase
MDRSPARHSSVRGVHLAAFGDHGPVVAGLVDDLLRDPAALSLVEIEDEVVAGHVMFTRGLLDAPRRLVDVQVLSPLAVLPSHQRRGIGRALIRRGPRSARPARRPAGVPGR